MVLSHELWRFNELNICLKVVEIVLGILLYTWWLSSVLVTIIIIIIISLFPMGRISTHPSCYCLEFLYLPPETSGTRLCQGFPRQTPPRFTNCLQGLKHTGILTSKIYYSYGIQNKITKGKGARDDIWRKKPGSSF